MYNLFMGYVSPTDIDEDNLGEIIVSAARYLEYTNSETQMRYRNLSPEVIREIKSLPCLFMQEHCDGGAFIGYIQNIQVSQGDYKVTFRKDDSVNVISKNDIERIALELCIEEFEFYRTHWAIKNSDLFRVLNENQIGLTGTQSVNDDSPENTPPPEGAQFNRQIFIVHGHDEHAKNDVKNYVEEKGLEPIILHLQASGGRTIIEKIDHYSNVGFGIVLYTECDLGAKRDTLGFKWRARQNVVFEHGYLIAKLSRARVAALVKGTVETPNDISGVVYVAMDPAGNWKVELDAELVAAGYELS